MKRTTFAALALAATAWECFGGTMQTASTTNELVLLNPYTINTNTFVVSEGAVGDTTATVWTFVNGDVTGPDATHLAPTLYPASGRWVKNTGGSGGTNIFNTIIVTNLTVISNLTADTLWTNKASVLQPSNLTLPLMWTNSVDFSGGGTNTLRLVGSQLTLTNKSITNGFQIANRSDTHLDLGFTGTGANPRISSPSGFLWLGNNTIFEGNVLPDADNTRNLGSSASSGAWHDSWFKGTHYIESTNDGLGNTSWMKILSTNGVGIFDLANAGTGFAPAGFSFRTNGVEIFNATGSGGPSSGANWVAVGATDSRLAGMAAPAELYTGSFKLYRGALTPVDAGVSLDFGSTNRYWSITLTGAVTFATANLAAGKHANVMITGVATNANYTWPANWIWIGFKPTFIGANKHGDLYLKATSNADSGIWAYYGEEN